MLTGLARLARVAMTIFALCMVAVVEAQGALCPDLEADPDARLHIHIFSAARLSGGVEDDYDQLILALRQEVDEIVDELVIEEDFGYLNNLSLVEVEHPGYQNRGQRIAYFEDNKCVLQTIETVPKNTHHDDGRPATRFIYTSVPGPCFGRKPCRFSTRMYIPPDSNEKVLINFTAAITLYALSVDAYEACKAGRAGKLRDAALKKLDDVNGLRPDFGADGKIEGLRHDLEQPPEPPDACGG